MTEKELHKLSKEDLIEIIYQLKVSEDNLRTELEEMKLRLEMAESLSGAIDRLNKSIDKIESICESTPHQVNLDID